MKTMKTTKLLLGTLITLALLTCVHAQSYLTNGLVAYYPFNGNALDASGNGNNGTVNGAVFQTFGEGSKQTLSFNGTASTYVQVPESASLEPTNAITISVWCKGLPGYGYGDILRKANNCWPGYYIRFYEWPSHDLIPGFGLSYGCGWNNGGDEFTNFLACTGTDWQNLIATYTASNGLISTYENGVLIATNYASTPSGTGAIVNTGDLFIGGATVHPYDGGFAGLINEVRIYNRALSVSEVQRLYVYGYALQFGSSVTLLKAVQPSFSYLLPGTNYQLQVSGNLNTWTNQDSPFTATTNNMIYPQYFNVDNWGKLFFRLQASP
jgi:hypothetical protein